MDKIRYRLVYNRKKKLNRQGTALVQVECSLNGRKIYLTTNVYLKPECWDKDVSQVCNHPQELDLNAMLYEYVLELQAIEISLWKRAVPVTLSALKALAKKHETPNMTFLAFAKKEIDGSDKKEATKENLKTTVTLLAAFRQGLDFKDITYSFLKEFESFLRERGNSVNTIAKHLRQLRTLVNEAINQGYIHADAYPFRKYKIRQEKGRHEFLTPGELKKLERLDVEDRRLRHVLDAFLFCCYVGLRFSDFCRMRPENFMRLRGNLWLVFKSQKTGVDTRIPLYLLFGGKGLEILSRYELSEFTRLGCNADANRSLARITSLAGLKKHITYHSSRHTCATLLVHQGVPITTVQKLLGHTSVKTTEIYSEVLPGTIVRDLKTAYRSKNVLSSPKNNALMGRT